MKITFIQTGGTIDKDYPRTTGGWAFEISDPAVERILKKLNPSFQFEILSLFKKDSLEITDKNRLHLKKFIENLENNKIIITHGTDTMIKTAQFLYEIPNKLIILTGAMRPEQFANSDAPINIGTAIGAVNILENGIYIAMHGLVLSYEKMERNLENGKFQSL